MKTLAAIAILLTPYLLVAALFLAPKNPPPTVALAWDDAVGVWWKLHQGVGSRQYTNATATVTNHITVTLPTRGVTYYFAATAVATNGLESDFSTEVSYTPPQPPAPPSGMLQPVVLTVQYKNNPLDFMWADLFSQPLDPTQPFQEFRLAIANGPKPVAQSKRTAPQLPPLPGQ